MKRYWVFAGADFYANGGACDLVGRFAEYSEAKAEYDRAHKENLQKHSFAWAHIVNVEACIPSLYKRGVSIDAHFQGGAS